MEIQKKSHFILVFQKALLFNITLHTKLIAFDVINDNKLIIWVYLDKSPTADEKDVYFSVSAEVSGDFAELEESLSEVFFITHSPSSQELEGKTLLFARCDYLNSDGILI